MDVKAIGPDEGAYIWFYRPILIREFLVSYKMALDNISFHKSGSKRLLQYFMGKSAAASFLTHLS